MSSSYPDINYLRGLALEAGKIMREYFHLENVREWKDGDGEEFGSNETPLTIADTAINQMVLDRIMRDFPHVNAIGEEGSHEVPSAEYTVTWDPIDGTHAFMVGSAVSAFCISVLKGDTPFAAVIHDPLCFSPRTWHAERGKGTFLNDRQVKVSSHASLNRAQMCMVWWTGCRYNLHEVAGKLMQASVVVQNPVSLAYFGGLVASGQLEAAMFPGNKMWETAAMQCIIEEAGGRVTNIHGERVRFHEGDIQGCIASNGVLHDEILRIVRECQ